MTFTFNPVADAERYYNEGTKVRKNIKSIYGQGYIHKIWEDVIPMEDAYEYALNHYDFEEGESEEDYTEEELIQKYFEPRFVISSWEKF